MNVARHYPMQFTGTGGEYFRVWSVNILLSMITFGIYSAWAKVRTQRWFFGHTILDDNPFAYHATPIQILKGRAIAFLIFLTYFALPEIDPRLTLVFVFLLFAATPWIIVRSLRFNAYNTSFRGVRFGFDGTVGQSFKYFFAYPFLVVFSLGLALPFVVQRQTKFLIDHYRYGTTPFRCEAGVKPFYVIYGVVALLSLAPIGAMIGTAFYAAMLEHAGMDKTAVFEATMPVLVVAVLGFYLLLPIISAFAKARTANLLYNHTQVGPVRFSSKQRARELIWIFLSNLVLIALTFGIFVPWAKVRLARYRAEHLTVESETSLDQFTNEVGEKMASLGEELADVFDLDIGLS